MGEHYALVKLPTGTRGIGKSDIMQQVQQQSYVAGTLPVLARKDGNQVRDEAIVLPNEIMVSFEPGLGSSQIHSILDSYNLEVIRPLRFTQNRYLVKSRSASGVAILEIANRLHGIAGIQSATPNFVQSLPFGVQEQMRGAIATAEMPQTDPDLNKRLASLPSNQSFPKSLLPLEWHLDSRLERGRFPRTDIHAVEAWRHSNGGQGVVVAVIDSMIQWDHPDLVTNVYTVSNVRNKLPGETHGWNFSGENGAIPIPALAMQNWQNCVPIFKTPFAYRMLTC